MEQVEVKLLNYTLRFKRIRWQEHSAIVFPPNKDPQRVLLAHALMDASGIKPKSPEEALRVIDALPTAIMERVFKIWRGSFPPSRSFTTSRLFCAPEPAEYIAKIEEEEENTVEVHDKVVRDMEAKFGLKEVAEARELSNQILKAAQREDGGYKGAIPATEDVNAR